MAEIKNTSNDKVTHSIHLQWMRRTELMALGTGSKIVLAELEQQSDPPYRWQVKVGAIIYSGGLSTYIYDNEEDARKAAQAILQRSSYQ
jgi:hypothetical protein